MRTEQEIRDRLTTSLDQMFRGEDAVDREMGRAYHMRDWEMIRAGATQRQAAELASRELRWVLGEVVE